MAATHKALMELIRGIHNIKPRHRGCVLTIGNFDGVHQGHHAVLVRLQEKAVQLGLPACVMLFEPQPLELFAGNAAPARLSRWREKYEALKGMQIDRMLCVRFTHRFAEQAASTFIEQLLVEKLGAKAPNLLLVAQHPNGLRLTFFRERRFRLSRLTRGDSGRNQ